MTRHGPDMGNPGRERGRGLSVSSAAPLGHPSLYRWESKCRLPAVITSIIGPDGSLQSAQRVFVGEVEPRTKTMPPVDTLTRAAVRLHPLAPEMDVAEGVETVSAGFELPGSRPGRPSPPAISRPFSRRSRC